MRDGVTERTASNYNKFERMHICIYNMHCTILFCLALVGDSGSKKSAQVFLAQTAAAF